ncbi:hypothetical protein PENTCL1PPCAC_16649, partial [Pristionchus entomophagus]
MFHVLQKDSSKRSQETIKVIQRSLFALFIQLVIPLMLFVIPAIIIFLGLTFENLLSFEQSLIVFLILPLHSGFHNLILLTITSNYRKIILSSVNKLY